MKIFLHLLFLQLKQRQQRVANTTQEATAPPKRIIVSSDDNQSHHPSQETQNNTSPDITPSKRIMVQNTPPQNPPQPGNPASAATSQRLATSVTTVSPSAATIAQAIPMSFTSPVRSVYMPAGAPQQQPPQHYYQILSNGQQQSFVLQPHRANGGSGEGFFVIDPNTAPGNTPHYSIGTQVVAANQGLRMASHPNTKDSRVPLQHVALNPQALNQMNQQHQAIMNRFPTSSGNPNRLPSWNNQQQQRHQHIRHHMAIAHRQPLPQTGLQQQQPQPNHQYTPTPAPTNKSSSLNMHKSITPPSSSRQMRISSAPTTSSPTTTIASTNNNEARIALPFNPLPKLKASISASGNGIILTWDYDKPGENADKYKVECYQLFAHQAKGNIRPPVPNESRPWKKIGVVNALPLPMACTLTQFATGNIYYFAVVAVDIHGREGDLSLIHI